MLFNQQAVEHESFGELIIWEVQSFKKFGEYKQPLKL